VSPDARRERWRGHREGRREEMVDAAIRAIRAHGPAVAVGEIAAEAGVTKPVLYRLFADRADLYVAVGQRIAADVLEKLTPALSDLARGESPTRVAALLETYLAAIEEEPELYRFVVQQQGAVGSSQDVISDSRAVVGNALARIIGDRARARGADAGPAEPWGHGLVGLVQASADWWIQQGRPISRAALTEYLTRLIWHGISGELEAAEEPVRPLRLLPAER
jgi:AcrR family transcriptional regulator